MEDKTILVTGSTDGIGKQAAIELAELGARVVLHGRSESKARKVLQKIEQKTGNDQFSFVFGWDWYFILAYPCDCYNL